MVIILDENFNVTAVSDAVVNQGDAALGKIQVVAPFPNNIALLASFTLPNGTVTPRYPMSSSISATDKTKTIYTLNMPATIFSLLSGSVMVQFFALFPDSKETTEYSCLLTVKSGSNAENSLYAVQEVYICDKSLTSAIPEIIPLASDDGTILTEGLAVTENADNNAYYLSGGLKTADTQLSVTVKVTYATPQTIATAATNFNIRKGVAFDLPSFGDIDNNTWNYVVQQLNELSAQVSTAINAGVKELDDSETHNMWTLQSGYYFVKAGAIIYLNSTETLTSEYEDMLLFVENKGLKNASYIAMVSHKDSTGTIPIVPYFNYGVSDGGANWSKYNFSFGDYATEEEVQTLINNAVISVINTPI